MQQVFSGAVFIIILLVLPSACFAQTTPGVLDLGEIVVTGTQEPETATFFPGQVEVITSEEIKQSGAQNVLDLLNVLPGIYSVRDTALYGTPMDGINIRGQESFDKLAIIINGRPDNMMNIMGHTLLDPLAIDNIERVEIYKGPASVLFGSNARGGVINIITKKGSTEPNASFRQSAGSNNLYDSVLTFSDTRGAAEMSFSMGAKGTAGYLPDDPALAGNDNGAYRSVNNTAHIGYTLDPYRTISSDFRWNQFTGNPPNSGNNPLKRNRWGLDFMYETKHTTFKNNFHFYHGQGKHLTFGNEGFDSTDVLDGVRWTHQMQTGKNNLLLVGSDYERYGGRAQNHTGAPFITSIAGQGVWNRESRYSIFFSDTYNLTSTVSLNLGYRQVHDFITGWNGVPQIGIKFRPSPNSEIGLSYTKAYYTPSLRESLFFVSNFNNDLKPEFTEQFAIDYTIYKSKRLQFKTSLFQMKDTNRIRTRFGNDSTNSTSGNETTTGFETSFTRYFGAKTTLNFSYTRLNIEDTYNAATTFEHNNWAPENQFDVFLSHDFGKLSLSSDASWISDNYYVESTGANIFTNTKTATKLDDYALVNLHLNYPYTKGSTVFLHLKNVLNENYSLRTFSAGSRSGQPWKMPGRSFTLGFEWNL